MFQTAAIRADHRRDNLIVRPDFPPGGEPGFPGAGRLGRTKIARHAQTNASRTRLLQKMPAIYGVIHNNLYLLRRTIQYFGCKD
jgi:hypothetical protein